MSGPQSVASTRRTARDGPPSGAAQGSSAKSDYHPWITLLLRPERQGFTHRTNRRPLFSESQYWDHYANQTKYYDKEGPPLKGAVSMHHNRKHGTGRSSFRSTGRSIASSSSVDSLKASTRARHKNRMLKLQRKLEAAQTRREAAEEKVGDLNKKIDRICDHYGRIQVANPGQNLDEMEPMHRWELYLERTCNNLVALEEERRRQVARAEKQKTLWNKEDLGRC